MIIQEHAPHCNMKYSLWIALWWIEILLQIEWGIYYNLNNNWSITHEGWKLSISIFYPKHACVMVVKSPPEQARLLLYVMKCNFGIWFVRACKWENDISGLTFNINWIFFWIRIRKYRLKSFSWDFFDSL